MKIESKRYCWVYLTWRRLFSQRYWLSRKFTYLRQCAYLKYDQDISPDNNIISHQMKACFGRKSIRFEEDHKTASFFLYFLTTCWEIDLMSFFASRIEVPKCLWQSFRNIHCLKVLYKLILFGTQCWNKTSWPQVAQDNWPKICVINCWLFFNDFGRVKVGYPSVDRLLITALSRLRPTFRINARERDCNVYPGPQVRTRCA